MLIQDIGGLSVSSRLVELGVNSFQVSNGTGLVEIWIISFHGRVGL